MKAIVHVPHPVLSTPAKPVTSFDKKLGTLVADMTAALLATKNPKGVGLAAPQIGEPLRIFVTKPNKTAPLRVFINPVIVKSTPTELIKNKKGDDRLEGCLSIPNIWGKVLRAPVVTLEFQDETGKKHTEEFTDFMATIVQHETDHINGTVFTQRVLEQKGKLYQIAVDKEEKEFLEEIKL